MFPSREEPVLPPAHRGDVLLRPVCSSAGGNELPAKPAGFSLQPLTPNHAGGLGKEAAPGAHQEQGQLHGGWQGQLWHPGLFLWLSQGALPWS